MKILFTGGGSGGHFYPIIAVAQEVKDIIYENKLIGAKLYYMADDPYNQSFLNDNDIKFIKIPAGKIRPYFSIKNFIAPLFIFYGIIKALWLMYLIYPDVVFSKGGYVSVPALWAARILRIPVFIHESDSHPGKASLWSAKFAKSIALSYPEAVKYFPEEKTAVTGNPIRKEIKYPVKEGAKEYLKLKDGIPTIFILGGSQGAAIINETILEILPKLIEKYQVIHQVGQNNFKSFSQRVDVVLENNPNANRYVPFAYLNDLAMRMSAGAADLVVSRAGSGIFEIANWGLPSIIIPIPEKISHDQTKNAFTYARSKAAVVIEQNNLSPSVLMAEIDRLLNNPELLEEMKAGTKSFANIDAGRKIAEELLRLAVEHEK